MMNAPAGSLSAYEVQEIARRHRGLVHFVLGYILALIAALVVGIFFLEKSGPLTAETSNFLVAATLGLFSLVQLSFLLVLSVKAYRLLTRVGASASLMHVATLWVCLPLGLCIVHHFAREGLKRQGCQLGFIFAKGI